VFLEQKMDLVIQLINKVTVRFEVLTIATVKNTDFWDVAPCSLADNYRLLRETCGLQIQFNLLKPSGNFTYHQV
jgi:hypothetical protein